MERNEFLSKQLTIVVNSCDSYDDLWFPFFALLKKYWDPKGIRILLNTETRTFQMDGLEIECIHSPKEYSYGRRMLNVLSEVKTPYVMMLLDDFFLRTFVEVDRILQITEWMEKDPYIACFTCDCNVAYADWEVDRYPGYRRLPPGNDYILSMQAGVWRTECLINYWRPDVSPWEWEVICNFLTRNEMRYKFYCSLNTESMFMNYGHHQYGDVWGVYRGKWVEADVVPLFQGEGISVDYSGRGFYSEGKSKTVISKSEGRWDLYGVVYRCLGIRYVIMLFFYEVYCGLLRRMNRYAKWENFYDFLRQTAQQRFLKYHRNR